MKRSQQALVAGSVLACLISAWGRASQASGIKMDRDGHETKMQVSTFPLDSLDGLEVKSVKEDGMYPVKTKADVATYRGRRAVRIVNDDGLTVTGTPAGAQAIAIVTPSEFKDGTIEADVVGLPREGAPPTTRGFVGIAFRVQDHGSQYESIYLRMTNGRADDQLQRNHSTQYVSQPRFTWQRLRKENPGLYESYVDLEPGAWTRIKIVVAGTKARLYVNSAEQPCLIVNDLKLGETHGQVALWTGSNTEAYFSNLKVR
jgi:3-keto-disaccharide hydrolase